jgi:protein-histidine pros-kinase
MFLVDKEHKILLVNAQAEKIFGYSSDELHGQDIQILLPKRYHARHRRLMDNYFQVEPATRPMSAVEDIYAEHKDGREFPVDISLSQWIRRRVNHRLRGAISASKSRLSRH